jgi:predicted TIM-barrel fold metal-dependent hydrolase
VEKIGADRILFGTDWSTTWRWLSVPDTLHKIRLKVINDAGLSKPDREQIMWKTAASLFKLDGYLPANDR